MFLLVSCDHDFTRDNLSSGRVTKVFSGQTIEVVLSQTSERVTVRLTGIDAPDLRQSPWGNSAKASLSELIMHQTVELETESLRLDSPIRDRYNRLNAHVWQDQNLVSQKLVRSGYVLANTKYPHSYSKLLIEAQEYARLMGLGIWNRDRAMRYTPSQFRSRIKNK